MLWEVGNNR